MKGSFDNQAFYQALNSHRSANGLSWKDVAAAAGISASTLTRMAQGKRPDVDGLAALLKWSGLKAEDFIGKQRGRPEPLAQMTAILRSDPRLSASAKTTLESVLRATYEGLSTKPSAK